jgi:hypothetical protein
MHRAEERGGRRGEGGGAREELSLLLIFTFLALLQ